jgi:hypothetical protein
MGLALRDANDGGWSSVRRERCCRTVCPALRLSTNSGKLMLLRYVEQGSASGCRQMVGLTVHGSDVPGGANRHAPGASTWLGETGRRSR